MIEIMIDKEFVSMPTMVDGKYPKEIWGKFYKVRGLTSVQYCEEVGGLNWSLPMEIIDKLKSAHDLFQATPVRSLSVYELAILRKSFDLVDLIRLRKEGLIYKKPRSGGAISLQDRGGCGGF